MPAPLQLFKRKVWNCRTLPPYNEFCIHNIPFGACPDGEFEWKNDAWQKLVYIYDKATDGDKEIIWSFTGTKILMEWPEIMKTISTYEAVNGPIPVVKREYYAYDDK